MSTSHRYPYLHNAMWPGIVGKGAPDSEPAIDLDTMLKLTAATEVDGVKFDGVDLFLSLPHTDIDSSDDDLKRLADKLRGYHLVAGSMVAPVWAGTGGGSAMGSEEERKKFLTQVRKACAIGRKLKDLGIRNYGVVRIDSADGVESWSQDPQGNTARIAETFSEACNIAEGYGERLAAEGEIRWAGMHGWRHMVELLERVNRPRTLGFQADMAHTMLYVLGYNSPESRLLPENFDWQAPGAREQLIAALTTVADALRPWTIDFHVAQNDGTVKGSGSHDKTGRHCPPNDPNGRMDVVQVAGVWMRRGAASAPGGAGQPTRAFQHICWDGCMFPNAMMLDPATWRAVLVMLIRVRAAHGWDAASTAE